MRSAALAAMAVVLGLAVSPLAEGGKTFRPERAKLTFRLPATWHSTHPARGWSFEAVAPHFDAFLFLSAKPALVNDTAFLGSFVTFQRERSRSLGPHVIFRAKRITFGSVGAIETIASGKGSTTEFSYAFENGGLEYTLVYATTAELLAKERPAFASSVASIEFLDSP